MHRFAQIKLIGTEFEHIRLNYVIEQFSESVYLRWFRHLAIRRTIFCQRCGGAAGLGQRHRRRRRYPPANILQAAAAIDCSAPIADLPQIEGATGRFLLQSMVAVAELEAGMICARTKAALAKRRGRKLGSDRGVRPSAKTRAKGAAVISAQAAMRAADLAATIAELRASGATSLRAIAAGLNARGIPTARGSGKWSSVQVRRVLSRIG